jgi:putative phosphoesterase
MSSIRNDPLMRVAVVSDTHVQRFVRRMPPFLARLAAEAPDIILHCGDFTELAEVAPLEALAAFDGVAGNNDGEEIVRRFGRTKILELAGRRIGLVHGDGPRGTTLERARSAFRAPLDAILFGHSHVPFCERLDGTWLINPGSPTDKRRQARFSYAVIDIERARFEPRLVLFD